ncbi:MAG TPA: hypothetical protein VN700_00315 [Vicinamibacterales bacterium]|nr:hypothetical protein [Vicinamibacterales bacterium]
MRRLGVFLLVAILAFGSTGGRVKGQAAAALAVGAVFTRLESLAEKLKENARSLIEQGNNAAAEQQALLAGLIRESIAEARKAYADSLRQTIDQFGDLEKDAFAKLNDLADRLEASKTDAVKDVTGLIRQTHSAANQLLSAMPFTYKRPVFEGVLTRDVLMETDQNPSDLELLGFWLMDPDLKKKPLVRIKGPGPGDEKMIPPDYITAFFDRLQIQLPDDVKRSLYFANTPCAPRQTFQLIATVFYRSTRGYWPITWRQETQVAHSANVLPGGLAFQVTVAIDGRAVTSVKKSQPFTASHATSWGCESDNHPSVTYRVESGQRIVGSPSCAFNAVGKFENNPTCNAHVSGDTATASGYVRGANKIGISTPLGDVKNCPGGGNGTLVLTGQYEFDTTEEKTYSDTPLGTTMMYSRNKVQVAIPTGPGAVIQKVRIRIYRATRRDTCPTVHDEIEIPVPQLASGQAGNTVQQVKQSSRYGGFLVTVDRAQVTVERVY